MDQDQTSNQEATAPPKEDKGKVEKLEKELEGIGEKAKKEIAEKPPVPVQPQQPQPQQAPAPQPTQQTPTPSAGAPGGMNKVLRIALILLLFSALVVGIYFGKDYLLKPKASPTPTPVSTPTGTPDSTADWETYLARDESFTLKYPSGWYQYSFGGTSESFIDAFSSKPEDIDFGWRSLSNEDFAFSVQASPNEQTTFNNGWDMIQAFPQEKRTIGEVYEGVREIVTIVDLPIVDGEQAFEIERKPSEGFQGEDFYIREILLTRNNKIYRIAPYAGKGADIFETKKELFSLILSTFEFTEATSSATPTSTPSGTLD